MAAASDGDPTQLFPPAKKTKSAVWGYFGYRKSEENAVEEDGFPICRKCLKRVAAKGGNTISHLREHHPCIYSEMKCTKTPNSSSIKVEQPSVQQAFAKQLAYSPSSKQARDLNNAVAYYIAKDMLSFQ